MINTSLNISIAARKFLQEKRIGDVTFNLLESDVVGCCVGIVKEIVPRYEAPKDASNYRYVRADGYHIFISRSIKILGPLTLATEGAWKLKRLALNGATVPL
ncbi:MAG: hypothetical protein OET63_03620 [Desulfobacterales bacterium]|jgi:hypothetical protein|nr:hypothetical protein [Desulfobacterales bacterium]